MRVKNVIEPFVIKINIEEEIINNYNEHIINRLSNMKNLYLNENVYEEMLKEEDKLLYEVYLKTVLEDPGELIQGLTILYPGKVGNEFFMTKGHFHRIFYTSEIYFCLKGRGILLMETTNGNWKAEEMKPGIIIYVPGQWAHRCINIDKTDNLVTFFCTRADSGHDYKLIEQKGFRKLTVDKDNVPIIIDNPKWNKCKNIL